MTVLIRRGWQLEEAGAYFLRTIDGMTELNRFGDIAVRGAYFYFATF
jgi:hypothetical protein